METLGNVQCGQKHHCLLHGSANIYCPANTVKGCSWPPLAPRPDLFPGAVGDMLFGRTHSTLFELTRATLISHISDNTHSGIIFTDPQSNINFICTVVVEELGLKSTTTVIQLKVIDQDYVEKAVKVYQLGIVDQFGGRH